MVSLRFASWIPHAFRIMVVKISPRGMPSVHSSSSEPPRPWPFLSCGERLASMGEPSAGCRAAGTGWKRTRSRRGCVAMSCHEGVRLSLSTIWRMSGTYALESRIHETGVAVVDEAWRETGVLLFLLSPLPLPVYLLRCWLLLLRHESQVVDMVVV